MGAKEVHFRVSSPPVKYPCFYGIDFPSVSELIAVQHDASSLANILGLDSLHYLSLEGLKGSVSCPDKFCTACFTGDYPTSVPKP
jgi:amidophosphoribosyltransferase